MPQIYVKPVSEIKHFWMNMENGGVSVEGKDIDITLPTFYSLEKLIRHEKNLY